MIFAVNVLGWVGVVTLLAAYWLVSTQQATGASRTYQCMNLLGAILVLVNSSYYGAYPSVGVNAAWIAIGVYTLVKHPPTVRGGTAPSQVDGTAAVRPTHGRTRISTTAVECQVFDEEA